MIYLLFNQYNYELIEHDTGNHMCVMYVIPLTVILNTFIAMFYQWKKNNSEICVNDIGFEKF